LADLVVPERFRDSLGRAMEAFNQTGHSGILDRRLERVVVDRAGREFPIEMTAGLAGTTESAFFSVFLHDISERKRVERMKDEFVATVSHELRTPLTSIRASLSLLADGMAGELPADIKGLVDIASQSCERLVRMVGDVLDIQKIEAGNMELALADQPLLPLLDEALAGMRAYARQVGVTLERDCAADAQALAARVDRDRLAQVLTNLLSNAVKFSERGQVVTLRLDASGDKAAFPRNSVRACSSALRRLILPTRGAKAGRGWDSRFARAWWRSMAGRFGTRAIRRARAFTWSCR
jgi:signal transduction histidine kinase